MSPALAPRVVFVVGKRPRPGTLVAEVADALVTAGCRVDLHLPHERSGPPAPWWDGVHLVVQRGLSARALDALLPVEQAGLRCCNRVAATALLSDRVRLAGRLGSAGIPVPPTRAVTGWPQVVEHVRDLGSAVVKTRDGSIGRGAGVLLVPEGSVPAQPPVDGPWVVQPLVPGDGWDRKLYVAGAHVHGLCKPGPGTSGHPRTLDVPGHLRELADRTGAALGLDVYGVDVVEGPDGPVVVDVNAFPGFRGVAGATASVTCLLRTLLPGERVGCGCRSPAPRH